MGRDELTQNVVRSRRAVFFMVWVTPLVLSKATEWVVREMLQVKLAHSKKTVV